MTDERTLRIVMEARDRTRRGLASVSGGLRKTADIAKKAFAVAAKGAALTTAAVTLLGAGLFGITKNAAETADRIGKLSDRLGLTTEFLSEMEHAAALSGANVEGLGVTFQRAARRMEQFRQTGGGSAASAFATLGPEIEEAVRQGKDLEEVLPQLADAFKDIEDQQTRVRTAFDIFGKEGVSFVQVLQQGSGAIRDMRAEAEELGLSIGLKAAQDAAKFNDALERLTASFRGIKQAIGAELFVTMADAMERFAGVISRNRQGIAEFFGKLVEGASAIGKALAQSFVDPQARALLLDTITGAMEIIFYAAGETAGRAFSEALRPSLTKGVAEIADKVASTLRMITVPGIFSFREEAATIEALAKGMLALDRASEDIPDTWENATEQLEALSERFFEFFGSKGDGGPAAKSMKSLGEATAEVAKEVQKLPPLADDFGTAYATAAAQLRDEYEALGPLGRRTADELFGGLSTNFFDRAKRGFTDLKDFARATFQSIVDSALSIVSDAAASNVVSLFGQLLGGGGTGFGQGVNLDSAASFLPDLTRPSPNLIGSGSSGVVGGGGFSAAPSVAGPTINVVVQAMDAASIEQTAARNPMAFANAVVQVTATDDKVRQALGSAIR